MIDEVDINRRVRKLIVLCTGYAPKDVRPANQDGGATGDRWATVLMINNQTTGKASVWSNTVDNKVTETQSTHATVTMSIQFFRAGAMTSAAKLIDRITLSSAIAMMRSLGLGFVNSTKPKNMDKVVDGKWEERAALTMSFNVVGIETETVDTYGTFPIGVSRGEPFIFHEVNEP
jgi:hypothetical protein